MTVGEKEEPRDTVDKYIEAWTSAQALQLESWRQGLLVPCDMISWLIGHPEHPGELSPAAAAEIGTGYAAITSQTCDVVGSGPGARHPYVQVSPVRDLSNVSENKLHDVKLGAVMEYVYLTKPPEVGAQWAVDLRISVPLLKSALLNTAPVDGFASELDEIRFANRVAARLIRPAFHDAVVETTTNLGAFISSAKKKGSRVFDGVEQVRIEVLNGTALDPKSIRYMAVTDGKPADDLVATLIDFKKTQAKRLSRVGISLATPIAVSIEKVKVKDYRNSFPTRLPMLDRGDYC